MRNAKSTKSKDNPFYNNANIKELEKRYTEYKQHKGIEQHDLLKERK
ncbi:hypothetical protein [Limosilactobacillus allomucosae]|uniref:Uncharacterized protein n=1 Tax=Limosilactobacillus allomucosae TaxID=3142938 RepID=A0AAU7C5S1_9LACO